MAEAMPITNITAKPMPKAVSVFLLTPKKDKCQNWLNMKLFMNIAFMIRPDKIHCSALFFKFMVFLCSALFTSTLNITMRMNTKNCPRAR